MKHARPDYDRFQDPAGLIPADEPVFLLRGQDSLAHIAVRHYAFMAFQANATDIAAAAEKHADAMMAWAKKLPDMPPAATAEEIAAEERAARWNLDGRFVYRNKHGAVGYVDAPDSNPGLIAVIKVGGADAEQVAARLHAELSKPAVDTDALQADLRELLTILGMGDHARAASPHEVFQEALAVLRGRPLKRVGKAEGTRYQYREIGEGEDWRDCSKEIYDNFASHPAMDTREVPAVEEIPLIPSDDAKRADYSESRMRYWLEEAQRLALVVRSLGGNPEPGAPSGLERVRHLKRGSICEVLGEAEVQIATKRIIGFESGAAFLREGDKLTVYRHDGKLWVRFTDEFRDGRFETIAPESHKEPERIAQMLEDAAAKASPSRASTYRCLAAVLREPGFGEARHG